MLTPQEVKERSFNKASFGGYNMQQVDEFLNILTVDYSTLYSENALLKSKMKVLVDKVEEYRATEEAMRKALMTAQRMADELVGEAEQKKAEIMKNAEAEARKRTVELTHEVEADEFRLRKAQEATAAFVSEVRAAAASETAFLDKLETLYPDDVAAAPAAAEDKVDQAVSEIDDNVQRLLAQAMSDATAANLQSRPDRQPEDLSDTAEFTPCSDEAPKDPRQPEHSGEDRGRDDEDGEDDYDDRRRDRDEDEDDEEDDDMDRTCRIDFDSLQFGRDYEVK